MLEVNFEGVGVTTLECLIGSLWSAPCRHREQHVQRHEAPGAGLGQMGCGWREGAWHEVALIVKQRPDMKGLLSYSVTFGIHSESYGEV